MKLSRSRRGGPLVLILILVLGVPAPDATATTGTLWLSEDTVLQEDHEGMIQVFTPGITLDCAGHTVFGLPWDQGIQVGADDVTIRNCRVTGSLNGIVITAWARDVRLVANSSYGNVNAGIAVDPGIAPVIQDNVTRENGGNGIQLILTNGALVHGNRATGNQGTAGIAMAEVRACMFRDNVSTGNASNGFHLIAARDSVFEGNTVRSNGTSGIAIYESWTNLVVRNVVQRNGEGGFIVAGAGENELRRNVANANGSDGFVVEASDGNMLVRNIGNANGGIGFWALNGASVNTFEVNVGHGNGTFDAVDDGTGSGNAWIGNKVGTTEGL